MIKSTKEHDLFCYKNTFWASMCLRFLKECLVILCEEKEHKLRAMHNIIERKFKKDFGLHCNESRKRLNY